MLMELQPPVYADPKSRWKAVEERDPRADGRFVFAVTSTRIYCRPSCPARRPLAKHVVFFDGIAAAKEAGFRPCKRCKPDHAPAQLLLVARALSLMEAAESPPTLAELAGALGVSPFHFQRVFRRLTGLSPKQAFDLIRAQRFEKALSEVGNVTEAIFDAGYGSSRALYQRVGKDLGMRPSSFRRGGKGEAIAYTVGASPLGSMLVAMTARGVCALWWGEEQEMIDTLHRRFPQALMTRDDVELAPVVDRIKRALLENRDLDGLPIDAQGSEFQRLVWEALRSIPAGDTRTYAEVARMIGRPDAARAVARACATNPIALLIPCHRVLRASGDLAGYRWGLERKQELLAREGADAHD